MSKLAKKLIEKEKRERTGKLILGKCGLTKLPDFSELPWLQTLILSSMWFDFEFEFEEANRILYGTGRVSGENKIEILPTLSFPNGLTKLVAGALRITDIRFLENLTCLQYLDLSLNQIMDIQYLEILTSLKYLYLDKNQISDIRFLKNLTNLKFLHLNSNQVTDIRFLKNLTNLKSLNLSNNQITDISPILPLIEKGIPVSMKDHSDGICLYNNPLTNPPPEIVAQGNAAILEYFRQKKATGAEPLLEAKLILLGDGRSGKTSLANRLLRQPLPKEADRTEGVDIIIGDYQFPVASGRQFQLNIWDFAGQDKYKPLHQFFYSESSLYALVAVSGQNTTDFDDWLQTAQLFGEGSPLVVVLNEFKDGIGMGSFDREEWTKRFPDLIKAVVPVNLFSSQSEFAALEHKLQLLAQDLPHTRYDFPSNWAAIRRVLESRRNEHFISIQEYLRVCRENQLPERESALILSSLLHKVGVCLHYQQSDLLNQIVILNNEWATGAVYRLLEDKTVVEENCGFFDHDDMRRIWSDDEYADMRPQLLELMQQFKMAYPLPNGHTFVTPPLLPPAPPEDWAWPDGQSLTLYIEYEFLPKALLTQFIVSRHADIDRGRKLVWRNGVVLRWPDGTLAEVTKTKLQGKDAFHVRSQGPDRRGMTTVILNTFRELHGEYKGIKPEEKVPCPCEACSTGKHKQYYFKFEYLKRRLEHGRSIVECEESLEEVDLLKLLENHFVFERIQKGQPLQLKEGIKEPNKGGHTIKIFLASSAELAPERKEIEIAINRMNKDLHSKGIFLHLSLWEDGQCIGQSFRSQDNYNQEVAACDVFALLFYSKLGKYTKEEFNIAKGRFDGDEHPRILTFKKAGSLPANVSVRDITSLREFEDYLSDKAHFPFMFGNTDALLREVERCVDGLVGDEGFLGRV